MDNLIYYGATFLTIVTAAFGVFYIILAAHKIVAADRREKLFAGPSIVLWRLLSGVANILIGITLYWHLNKSMTSTVLILLTLSAFAAWEWYVRTNFVEDQAGVERDGTHSQ